MFGEGLSALEMVLQVIALGIAMWGWYKYAELAAARKLSRKQMALLSKMIEQGQKVKALCSEPEGKEKK